MELNRETLGWLVPLLAPALVPIVVQLIRACTTIVVELIKRNQRRAAEAVKVKLHEKTNEAPCRAPRRRSGRASHKN